MNQRLLAAAVAASMPASAFGQGLHLVCMGDGTANRATATTVYGYSSNGNSAWGQAYSRHAVGFGDQVDVQIGDDGTGKIRMPRAMLPRLHGGNRGWFDLKDLRITDSEITGAAQVNFMNSPKVRLDRMTGHISIDGKAGDFSGECRKFDPASAERKF